MTRKTALLAGAAAILAALLLALWLLGGPGPSLPPTIRVATPPRPALRPPPAPAVTAPEVPAVVPEVPAAPEAAPEPVPETPVVLEGRVVGLRDEGIEGAEVALYSGRDLPVEPAGTLEDIVAGRAFQPMTRKPTPTGPDGAFRLTVPRGTVATILATAPGWVPARLENLYLTEDRKGLLLRLGVGVAIAGSVRVVPAFRGEPPKPIESAVVRLLDGGGGKWKVLGTAQTDAEGRFALPVASAGRLSLLATAQGFRPGLQSEREFPAEGGEVLIQLAPSAHLPLRGSVHVAGSGAVVAGAEVRAFTSPGLLGAEASATTDGKGEFAMDPEVPPGSLRIPLLIQVRAGERGAAARRITAWPGETVERIVLTAPPTGVLRCRVVDATPGAGRAGVPGVALRAGGPWVLPVEGGGEWSLPLTVDGVSGKDGTVVLAGLPGWKVQVALAPGEKKVDCAEGFPAVPFEVLPAAEVELEVIPRRPRSGTGAAGASEESEDPPAIIWGAVIAPDGSWVPGARVWGFGPGVVIADERGSFALRCVIAHETPVVLHAEAPGFRPGVTTRFGMLPGTEMRSMAVFLGAEMRGLLGRVVNAEGRPLGGVRVTRAPTGSHPGWRSYDPGDATVTRTDGCFRFEVPAGSTWRLTASRRGLADAVLEDVPAGGPVPDLVLRPPTPPGSHR